MLVVDGRLRGHDEKGGVGVTMEGMETIRISKIKRGFYRLGLVGLVPLALVALGFSAAAAWTMINDHWLGPYATHPMINIFSDQARGQFIYSGAYALVASIWFGVMWAVGWVFSGFLDK